MRTPRFCALGIGLSLLFLGTLGQISVRGQSLATTGTARMHGESNVIYSLKPMVLKPLSSGTDSLLPEYFLDPAHVQKVAPDLVEDDNGATVVRYDAINLMLLNEFLQAKRIQRYHEQVIESLTTRVQSLEDDLKSLRDDMNALKARQDALENNTQVTPAP